MNLPSEVEKLEARLSPNARYAAWLQHESAGDDAAANRLRFADRISYFTTVCRVDDFDRAMGHAMTVMLLELQRLLAQLEMMDLLVLPMANAHADHLDFACFLFDQEEIPDDLLATRRAYAATRLEQQVHEVEVAPHYAELRVFFMVRLACVWRGFEAFCADEKIDPQAALHAGASFPLADRLANLADDFDSLDLSAHADEIDAWRERFLDTYTKSLQVQTPPWEQARSSPRRALRENERPGPDDLDYLDDVEAARVRIEGQRVLVLPESAKGDVELDEEGWAIEDRDDRSYVHRAVSVPVPIVPAEPRVCPVCTTEGAEPPNPPRPGDTLCAEHATWRSGEAA